MIKDQGEMHSMNFHSTDGEFDSRSPESSFSISLADQGTIEVDYEQNPNLLLEIEEFRNVVGLSSPVQAAVMVNHDSSCWITNLGRSGTTEVYRPFNRTYRRLAHQQVAYLRHGDFVGFYRSFYRVEFEDSRLCLIPVDFLTKPRFQ